MTAPGRIRWLLSIVWKLALLVGILYLAEMSRQTLGYRLAHLLPTTSEAAQSRAILVSTAVFIILLALPFVPGAEVGLAMMMMAGPAAAPLVYGGTVVALTLSFLVGRLVPVRAIRWLFTKLRLGRAAALLAELEPLDQQARLGFLISNTASSVVPFLLAHRYLALMLALNLPGNFVIGGGGGICLVAGFCRLFSLPRFVLAVMVAVLPVPLLVMLIGH